jgi:hypothetical protein
MRRCTGQATVETVLLLPLLLAAGLAVYAFLAAGAAREQADAAAHGAAIALIQGRDAKAAARAALPKRDHDRMRVEVARRRVRVRVAPAIPLFADRLAATSSASAGVAP